MIKHLTQHNQRSHGTALLRKVAKTTSQFKTIVLTIALGLMAISAQAGSGIFESYVKIGSTFYDLGATTGNPDFQGASLGAFTSGATISLNGEVKTFKNGPDNICGGRIYYSVYPASGTPGTFTQLNLPFQANLSNPGDQQWGNGAAASISLAGYTPGSYKIAVYVGDQGDAAGGCTQDPFHVSNNGGAYWIADFTVSALTGNVVVTATGGTTGPTSYTTVSAAFAAINAGTHTGALSMFINGNVTETAACVLNSSGAGTASYTSLVIRPTGTYTISGPTVTGRGLIELNGADNVTIDGCATIGGTTRNLTFTNSATSTLGYTSVIRLATLVTSQVSCDNNTIRNCNINGSATSRNTSLATSTTGAENTTFGIYAGGNAGATAAAPAALTSVTSNTAPSGTTINNLTITNNTVNACARGIVFNGAVATVCPGTLTITQNLVGDQSNNTGVGPITSPTTTVYTKGIWVAGASNLAINSNSVKNILSYVGTAMNGIELVSSIGATGAAISLNNNTISYVVNNGTSGANGILVSSGAVGYSCSNNTISNIQTVGGANVAALNLSHSSTTTFPTVNSNNIHSIFALSTAGWASRGIVINSGNGFTLSNNMIRNLNASNNNSTTSTVYAVKGIAINAGLNHKVLHNSVYLSGAMLGANVVADNTTCLMIAASSLTGIEVRNNIFANKMTGAAATVHGCMQLPSGATSSMNLNCNNNAYYFGTAANSYVGIAHTTFASYANLAALKAYTQTLSTAGTNDNASYASNGNPAFLSTSDLHLDPAASDITSLESAGAAAGITTDFDGQTRPNSGATIPDIGADEIALAGCTGLPNAGTSAGGGNKCVGSTATLTASGLSTGPGISYQWNVSSTSGGPYTPVSTGTGATTASYTTATLAAGTYYYVLTTTCSTSGLSNNTNEQTVVVNALPAVAITPSTSSICKPIASSVTLTASGASTYAWAPASVTSATGATTNAVPAATTTYTVTGTDAFGCTSTSSAVVNVAYAPSITSISSTPASICAGATATLNASASYILNSSATPAGYAFSSGTQTYANLTGATTSTAVGDDGTQTGVSLGFGFDYFGTNYTSVTISTNGVLFFGAIPSLHYTNDLATKTLSLGAMWDDNNASTGTVRYLTTGTTPNRKFTVEWFNTAIGGGGATASSTNQYQITLHEGTNKISFNYGSLTSANGISASVGISGGTAGQFVSVTPGATATASTSTANNGIAAVTDMPSGTLYEFTPNTTVPVTNFDWQLASDISGSNTISNPTTIALSANTTYTVTANNAGCLSTTTVSVAVGSPLVCNTPTVSGLPCTGSQQVTANVSGGGSPYTYAWTEDGNPFGGNTASITASAGTHDYAVNITDGCGANCSSSLLALTTYDVPTVTASTNAPVCAGQMLTVSASASIPSTYAWSGPSSFVGAASTETVTATAALTNSGTYTVVAANASQAACTAQSTVSVQVLPLPAVAAFATPSSFCLGGSSVLSISNTAATPYCTPTVTNNNCANSDEFISNVTFAGINNSTTCDAIAYKDYTSQVANVVAGTAYTLNFTNGFGYSGDQGRVWIDLNDNGVFTDVGEAFVTGAGTTPTNYNIPIVIPTSTPDGLHRMRVRLSYTGTMDPCSNMSYGEIEDYTVSVTGGVSYVWTPGLSAGSVTTVTPTASTIYTVTATTSVGGCAASSTVSVSVQPVPVIDSVITNQGCHGANDKTIEVYASPAGTYTYAINPNVGTTIVGFDNIFTELPAGTYTVSVTDGTCAATSVVTINDPAAVVASATQTAQPTCFGGANGEITISAVGGIVTGPYTIDWYLTPGTIDISGAVNSGVSATSAASYTVVVGDDNGCTDTLTSLSFTQPSLLTGSSAHTACNTLTVGGQTYTASGTHNVTYTNAAGCDSVHTYTVTINYSNTGSSTHTACNTITLPSGTHTTSGAYTATFTNAAGCDSVHTYNVTINYSNTGSSTHTACNTITLPSGTHTTSGAYTATFTNAAGCDSVHTYNVTINYSNAGSSSHTACNTLTVGGQTYTASGTHNVTYTNAAGCDSVHTYTVTINYSNTGSSAHTACNTLTVGGQTYTASGTHNVTYTNAAGCDSVHTYTVTINYSNTGSSSHTACNTLTVGGQTYTASGTHNVTYTNAAGCDSVHTYTVTINYSSTGSSTHTACNTITLPSGTHTTSGAYTATFTNAVGCDSVHTYNVTINNSASTTTSVTAPFTYTLPWGTVVTASGTYTNMYSTVAGCDSLVTINLTISGVRVSPKAYLSGPLSSTGSTMTDNLRSLNLVPLTEPYGTMNSSINPYTNVYTHVGGGGGETVSPAILANTGNNAIVDWVFLQLHSSTASGAVVATRSALIQRDGDIVEVDGVSPVEFPNVAPGNYHLSVKHRNHAGVLTNASVALGATATAVDFTSTSLALFTRPAPANNAAPLSGAARTIGTVRALYAGNCGIATKPQDRIITYNSTTASDRYALLTAAPGTSTINGYSVFDCDMNGLARFNGLTPDRLVILANCLNSNTLIIHEQLP
ncbi:MAG: hypothetical protein RL660_483 [Bacteroidota bacterium]